MTALEAHAAAVGSTATTQMFLYRIVLSIQMSFRPDLAEAWVVAV